MSEGGLEGGGSSSLSSRLYSRLEKELLVPILRRHTEGFGNLPSEQIGAPDRLTPKKQSPGTVEHWSVEQTFSAESRISRQEANLHVSQLVHRDRRWSQHIVDVGPHLWLDFHRRNHLPDGREKPVEVINHPQTGSLQPLPVP